MFGFLKKNTEEKCDDEELKDKLDTYFDDLFKEIDNNNKLSEDEKTRKRLIVLKKHFIKTEFNYLNEISKLKTLVDELKKEKDELEYKLEQSTNLNKELYYKLEK